MKRILQVQDDNIDIDNNDKGIEAQEYNYTESQDSTVLYTSVTLYGTCFIIITILFCWFRQQFSGIYNVQKHYNTNGYINWIYKLYQINQHDIMKQSGMDAVCVIRLCRMGLHISMIGILCSIFLIPIYVTASDEEYNNSYTTKKQQQVVTGDDKWVQLTSSNIAKGSKRYIGTVVAAYIIFGYFQYLIIKEFQWFTKTRAYWLSRCNVYNYTIYISGISQQYCSNTSLTSFFQQIFSQYDILQTNIVLYIPTLINKINELNHIQQMLEHYQALYEIKNIIQPMKTIMLFPTQSKRTLVRKVPGITYYQNKIQIIKQEIHNLILTIEQRQYEANIQVPPTIGNSAISRRQRPYRGYNIGDNDNDLKIHDVEIGKGNYIQQQQQQEQFNINNNNQIMSKAGDSIWKKDNNNMRSNDDNENNNSVNKNGVVMQGSDMNYKTMSRSIITGQVVSSSTTEQLSSTTTSSNFDHNNNNNNNSNVKYKNNRKSVNNNYNNIEPLAVEVIASAEDDEQHSDSRSHYNDRSMSPSDQSYVRPNDSADSNNNSDAQNQNDINECDGSSRTTGNIVNSKYDANADNNTEAIPLNAGLKTRSNIVKNAVALIGCGDNQNEGIPINAGFVTFTNLASVNAAVQMIHSTVPFQMNVTRASIPETIIWKNIGLSHQVVQFGKFISFALTTVLIIFWTVPVTFLVSLTEVNALRERLDFVDTMLQEAPWMEGLLSQLSPLIISLMNGVILPAILKLISKREGLIDLSTLNVSMYKKLAAFHIVQTLFVASIAGSVTSALGEAFDNPRDVVRFLATTLPPQSVFFIQILLIDTVISLGLEMIRVTAIVQAWFRKRFGPKLTENERNRPWIGLRPIRNPRQFLFDRVLARMSLHFVIFFTYTLLAPLIAIFFALAFLIAETCYRHQFAYIYPSIPDSGGLIWLSFIHCAIGCMFVAEITLVGYLALAEASLSYAMAIPLVVITALFTLYLKQKHFSVALHLSSEECVRYDTQNVDQINLNNLKDKYMQPALKKAYEILNNKGSDETCSEEAL